MKGVLGRQGLSPQIASATTRAGGGAFRPGKVSSLSSWPSLESVTRIVPVRSGCVGSGLPASSHVRPRWTGEGAALARRSASARPLDIRIHYVATVLVGR